MNSPLIKTLIFDFVASVGSASRRDIAKFYVEKIKGRTFDPVKDRNVMNLSLSTAIARKPGYLRYANGDDKRCLVKIGRNKYAVKEENF